jgi:hypothetical protein
MRAVFEARKSQGPPPSVTHAAQMEQLRQLCEQHRDATCRLRRASATDLLARAIHAARLGLPAPRLPAIPADLLAADAVFAMG